MGRMDSDDINTRGGRGKKNNEGRQNKVLSLDQYRWRKAGQALRQKLGEFALDPMFSKDISRAQHLYLMGLDPDLVDDHDEMIMERCFEWFIFDYVMEGGETLIDIYASLSDSTDIEGRLLREWSGSRLSLFEVYGILPGKGLKIRDLIFDRKITVSNYGVTGKLDKGSVLFMRVLRVGNEYEFSTGGLALPPVCGRHLVKKIRTDIERYAARKRRESFSLDGYLKTRAHKINSWVLDLAFKEPHLPDRERDTAGNHPGGAVSLRIAQHITDIFLDDYYEKWVNQPSQALDGKTPAESCKTVHGRVKVEELLKELEKMERGRVKKGEPHYDINKVRARLGLIPGEYGSKAGTEKNQPPGREQGGNTYHWNKKTHAAVASLIKENLQAKNYSGDRIEGALKLWSDYCSRENPTVRKENLWLATVVYALARLEMDGTVQQQKLADEYGISSSSLSGKYRSICKSLDLTVFDRRYTSGRSPIEELELSDPLLAKIFFRLKL